MGELKRFSFENLDVWKAAMSLAKSIYTTTKTWPKEEMYGLTSQVRRACTSISLNIAEGSGKYSLLEQAKFTNIAYCSCLETINVLILAKDLEMINEETYIRLRKDCEIIAPKLVNLRNSQLKRHKK